MEWNGGDSGVGALGGVERVMGTGDVTLPGTVRWVVLRCNECAGRTRLVMVTNKAIAGKVWKGDVLVLSD